MRRLLLIFFALLCVTAPAQAAIALVAGTNACQGSATGLDVTSDTLDTTGATLIVVAASGASNGSSTITLTDSKSNTWTGGGYAQVNGGQVVRLFWTSATSVGAGHTFSPDSSHDFTTVCVMAFSGTSGSPLLDLESAGGTNFGTTVQPGSITPSANNYLHCAALAFNTAGTITVSTPHDGLLIQENDTGNNQGLALACDIQTTATARNPTFTNSVSSSMAAMAVSLKDVGAAAPSAAGRQLLLGVGP